MPLPSHLRPHAKGRPRVPPGRNAAGVIHRGVVLKVYTPDDPQIAVGRFGFDPSANPGVTCDVQLIDRRSNTVLKNVPILTQSAGLNDYEEWHPQDTAQAIGQPLTKTVTENPAGPTRGEDMVGDWVVVAYLANDLNQPVIIGQLPHPKTNSRPSFTALTQYKWRRFLRGISIGVTAGGDVELDLSTASDGTLDPATGAYVPLPTAGNMTVTMQPGALLKVLDSVASAPEALLRGDTFLADLDLAFAEVMTAFIGLGLPTTNIAALKAQILASQGAGIPYLSLHIESD